MGKPDGDWEKELLERAREIKRKKSGKLTFEATLSGDKKVLRIRISGGPTSWYEEGEKENS